MEAQTLLPLPVLLALEPVAGESPMPLTLARDEAAELAQLVAADLLGLVPQVENARLVLAGALFDQVELLRPGFPVWAALDELALRVPRAHLPSVVAFGHHEGRMPAPELEPSAIYADGPMRLLPVSLLAPAALTEELSTQLEIQLVGRGEAGVKTADWLMRILGVRLEHVRYLSRNDLLALTCVQYEHVNLAPLWALLETALLTPQREESTMSARGLSLRYAGGTVRVQSPAQWLARQAGDPVQRAHDFAGIVFELRQYAALLDAHRVPLGLESAAGATAASDGYLLETRAAADVKLGAAHLFAHEAPGLGVVAVTVAQPAGAERARVLAHGYPLQPQALGPLLQRLTDDYGIASELDALGRVVLDEAGELGAPASILH
ncbi:MAG: hypothetical protein ABI128_15025 [Rhodanobacter sp.]